MKNIFYLFILGAFLIGCRRPNAHDPQLAVSLQRLSELNKNKASDTLVLRGALDSAYQIASKTSDWQHDSLFAAVSRLYGNALYNINTSKATSIYQKGLSIGLRQLPATDNIIIRLYINTARLYHGHNDYKTALNYFDSVKINAQTMDAENLKRVTMPAIADCFMRLNDPKSAINVMSGMETMAQRYTPQQLIVHYTNYALCLKQLKKYPEATQKTNLADSIIQKLKTEKLLTATDSISWANNAFEQGHIFHESKNFQKSENYYLQALRIYDQQQDLYNYLYTLRNLGNMYFLANQFEKGEQMLTKGVKICDKSASNDAIVRIKLGLLNNRSDVYIATKQYEKSIADLDSAIYLFNLHKTRPSLTPVMMQARPVLLSVLSDKAKAHIALAEKGEDTEGYAKALKLMAEITTLTDDIRADYLSDEAKLTLAENAKPAFEKAIELCHTLFQKTKDTTYLHRAFTFAEQSRNMILYENARLKTQLPDNLKVENEQLKKMEGDLLQKSNTDDLQNYLRLKRQFREKIKVFNKNKTTSVAEIQAQLLKDQRTALVEYFVGDSSIFILTITPKDFYLQKLPKTADFEKRVATLRDVVIREDNKFFIDLSNAFYDEILPEWIRDSTKKRNTITQSTTINKLIIIPDGVLNYIPFEMLLSNKPTSLKNADFLLKHYTISYAASANLLIEQAKKSKGMPTAQAGNTAQNVFAGYAPQYQSQKITDKKLLAMRAVLTRDSAYDLPGAFEEVQQIQTLVGGKSFLKEKADKTQFKKDAPRYKILHLAMHGLVDENNPANNRLLFTKNPKDTLNDCDLTAAELNTMTLNADLAVLSACNTGFGKLSKGEGVMSVARAFNYAGVPSTVMSLWVAPDAETSGIMIDFYKNLKTGMTKDEALRQAKLHYLDNVKLEENAAPARWAAFVLSGNTDAVDFDTPLSIGVLTDSIWAYIGVGLAVLAGVFLFLRLKKRRVHN